MKFLFLLIIFCPFIIQAQNYNTAQPYVILISFDGFRHDYLDRNISPTLSAIATEGVRAKSLQSCFPSKTFPNHISILTGMYPENHGIISNKFLNIYTGKSYSPSDSNSVRSTEWYQGEFFWETANRHGIKTASYFGLALK